jgi:hypothetical protein
MQPIQPGEKKKEDVEMVDPRRSGIAGGDVVRDCSVIEYVPFLLPSLPPSYLHIFLLYRPTPMSNMISDHPFRLLLLPYTNWELTNRLPPVLCDPLVAKAHYDKIEKEVEEGVRQSQIREKAFGQKPKPAENPTSAR